MKKKMRDEPLWFTEQLESFSDKLNEITKRLYELEREEIAFILDDSLATLKEAHKLCKEEKL